MQVQSINFLQTVPVAVDGSAQVCVLELDLSELFLDPYLALPQLLDLPFKVKVPLLALLELTLILYDGVLHLIMLIRQALELGLQLLLSLLALLQPALRLLDLLLVPLCLLLLLRPRSLLDLSLLLLCLSEGLISQSFSLCRVFLQQFELFGLSTELRLELGLDFEALLDLLLN